MAVTAADQLSRLFVALDLKDAAAARQLVGRLDREISAYKIGLELLFASGAESGLELAEALVREGKSVFLDMKLLDIPNTVENATRNISARGFGFLTVHGSDRRTLDAAVTGRGTSKLKLLAVTVLTSVTPGDLEQQGVAGRTAADVVVERALRAKAAGFDGVIASGHEAQALRAAVGPEFLIVTPGIRLPGDAAGDQARVMSPGDAISAGASHLVIGRSITAAADPRVAARACLADMSRLPTWPAG